MTTYHCDDGDGGLYGEEEEKRKRKKKDKT